MYNPRIRANSEVLRTVSQFQADVRKQLSGPTGTSAISGKDLKGLLDVYKVSGKVRNVKHPAINHIIIIQEEKPSNNS